MSYEEMTGVLRQLADTDLLDHELTHYEEQAREILSAEGAPTEYAPELIDYWELSERGRDARKVLTAARAVRDCRREGNLDWAAIQAMAVVTAATRAHMRLFEPDVALGQNRRQQQQDFAQTRAQEYQAEREAYWKPVLREAQRLVDADHDLAKSKTRLAKEVQKSFGLFDAISTIRKKLKDIKPTPIK